MSDDLRHIATEVFLSIPPAVRTGVFIDVFTPCDWLTPPAAWSITRGF